MSESATIEQRLTNLEQVVLELQNKVDSSDSHGNWLEKMVGSISDDAAFLEILEYGRMFRQSDELIDDHR
ncbi:transferase hexapeptide repeat containing protein [Synechocystis sp. LEGE 06083]|uniref:transferase hexapeptide repeat containing protein n=1 Tax=Synechocystis sp. LEGE 06083 TaxID=915336 RepID=UPI00187F35B3|nr:transferase hexapeptide repeat containing protein [Synechocystis sp. LEGE 06083]MBE9195634.1 transferase hexapeptide repeat containing protein [Synechocystis sp. LEGE 06083]